MVDSNIAMQVQGLDTATPIRQARQDENNNALAAEQILKAQYDNMNEREKYRLQSTVVAASQLQSYLERDDVEGAHEFLVNRRNALQNRMGAGENVDTQETDYALDKIRRGDLDGLKNDVSAMLAAGRAFNMVSGNGMPASVQEWQYYNSLSPQDQKRWLENKRANQVANLGDRTVVLGPDGKPKETYAAGLAPADQPSNAANKAAAVASGTAAGENDATAANTIGKMQGLMASFENLKTSSAKAPGGLAANLGADISNKSGVGGAAADAQGDFTVKRAAAENEIRAAFRVAGSGAQSDADAKPFIDMLPVAEDSDSVKAAKVQAAMDAVRTKVSNLAASRNLPDPFNPQAPAAGSAPAGGMITVSNGKESFQIDPADLPSAQAEGFQQVQ
jgi:hypothetical protein